MAVFSGRLAIATCFSDRPDEDFPGLQGGAYMDGGGIDIEAVTERQAGIYEVLRRQGAFGGFEQYHSGIFQALKDCDEEIHELIGREFARLGDTLQLIAAENQCSRAVLAALGSVVQNKTTEGFIGARYHGGCEVVDGIESIAVERAKKVFSAQYANVQPHSGTSANQIVLAAILGRDDKILSLSMDQGGHVSHGEKVSFSGKFFEVSNYCVNPKTFLLDYDAVRAKALEVRPKLIICGASAYCRRIDFARYRDMADEAGAYLMADISHISGLVAAGVHQSPVDYAHFTTTSTYKPGGPRGGLILMGRDFETPVKANGRQMPLWKLIQRATFPGVQGTPCLNNIAAKAVFFKEMMTDEYHRRQRLIVDNAKALGKAMVERGYDVLTGGTDNHMVLVDVYRSRSGLTGYIAQRCLEDCGIVVNMNRLAYDRFGPRVTSGMRLGTPIVTRNGMGPAQMNEIAELVDQVLGHVQVLGERQYAIDGDFAAEMRDRVKLLCRRFPAW